MIGTFEFMESITPFKLRRKDILKLFLKLSGTVSSCGLWGRTCGEGDAMVLTSFFCSSWFVWLVLLFQASVLAAGLFLFDWAGWRAVRNKKRMTGVKENKKDKERYEDDDE